MKTGYSIELVFKITLKDKALLENIKIYFGVGTITVRSDGYIQYWVGSIKDLEIIVNHFDNKPLITQKWSDYQLFKQAFLLIKSKHHLTEQGLNKIVAIKAQLNKGLSNELKSAFPNSVPVLRPVLNHQIINPYWVVGFVDGEGCFFVNLKNSKKSKLGVEVWLLFSVTQHLRDSLLLKKLVIKCGQFYGRSSNEILRGDYVVFNFQDIISKIIPFF